MAALAWLFGGLLLGGLRDPRLWTAAACALWACGLSGARLSRRALVSWSPFVLWLLISTLHSDQPWKCVLTDARWASLALFCGLVQAADGRRLRMPWLAALGTSAAVLGAAGLWTARRYLAHGGAGNHMEGLLPPYYNYTAFVVEAAAAACAAPLLARQGPRGARRRGAGVILAFSAAWLCLARARGGLLGAGAGIFIAAWRQGRLRWRHTAIAAATAAGLALAALMNFSGAAHWLKLDQPESFKRPQIWTAALRAAAERPLTGWGPGNFEEGFLRHNFPSGEGPANYQFSTPLAHSEPLNVLAETGVVGLLLLLWALARSFPIAPPDGDWEREAALAAAVAMGAHCLIDDFSQIPALGMLFLSACVLAATPSEPERETWPFPVLALGLVFSALGLAPTAMNARLIRAREVAAAVVRRLDLLRGQESLFPADAYLREQAARAALRLSPPDPALARSELVVAEDLNPTNALLPGLLAQMAASERRWDQAAAQARRALGSEPNYLGARLLLAEALRYQGRAAEARAELDELRRRAALWAAAPQDRSGYERELASLDSAGEVRLERDLLGPEARRGRRARP